MNEEIVITYSVHKDGRVIQQSAYEVVIIHRHAHKREVSKKKREVSKYREICKESLLKSREIFRNYAYRQTHKREVSTKERFQKEIERNLYALEVREVLNYHNKIRVNYQY